MARPSLTSLLGSRASIGALLVLVLLPLLACTGTAQLGMAPVEAAPGWACPSPTPQPYGEAGPVKEFEECNCGPHPETGIRTCSQCPVYYALWEREYPSVSTRPFPSPTPYVRMGTTFRLGQRVSIPPVFALVNAGSGPELGDGQQLHVITITWTNPTTRTVAIDYGNQVQLTAVTRPDARVVTRTWSPSSAALRALANLPPDAPVELPDAIPPGVSSVQIPVIADAGTPHAVALTMRWAAPPPADPAAPTPTPTPNAELRAAGDERLAVQFVNEAAPPVSVLNPACDDPGATTNWRDVNDGFELGGNQAVPIAVPPGVSRVVQVALAQQGKRYVWGAKGPGTFDCSGLMSWSYAQVGISIPGSTAGQWPGMQPVAAGDVQPGDLAFFDINGDGRIDHVGMMVSGSTMVHAVSPRFGIKTDDINHGLYARTLRGFRTVR